MAMVSKSLTKFRGKLPLKVFTLVADFPIQACELSDTPPPPVRTLNLSRKTFVERPKFVQGLFQRLGVLFLLTRAQRQVCVFHTKICPDTFTRRWQRFCCYKVGYDIEPIITASVAFYRDTTDIPIEIAVFTERISHFIMSPFPFIPFSEIEGEAIVCNRPTRLFQRQGLEPMPFLNLGSAAKFFEKSDIRLVNAFEFLLYRLTRQCFPMRVCRPFQIRQMRTHRSIVGIRQTVLVSLTLPLMEILVDLPHIIKQVAKTDRIRLIIKRIFVGFHGISRITRLSPE